MTRCIKKFSGIEKGIRYTFRVGDNVPERFDLHRVALEEGWVKAKPAPKNKAMPPVKNKSGAASRRGRASRKRMLRKSKT